MSATNGISGDDNLNPSAIRARPSTAKRAQKSRKSAPVNYLHAAARTYHDLGLPITLCRGKAPWHPDWPQPFTMKVEREYFTVEDGADPGAWIGLELPNGDWI